MPVPWSVIVPALPTLIDTAARLFRKADAPPAPATPGADNEAQIQSLNARLQHLESLEAEQAALIKQTLEQLQDAAQALTAASRRANLALVVAILSMMIAVGALLLR